MSREAEYHLVINVDATTTKHLHEVMDDMCLEIRAARTELENIFQDMVEADVSGTGLSEAVLPVSLSHRIAQAQSKAEITHTESFFYEMIIGKVDLEGKNKSISIQKRMEFMSTREIESHTLHPAIWRKAMLISAARRNPRDPATPAIIKTRGVK